MGLHEARITNRTDWCNLRSWAVIVSILVGELLLVCWMEMVVYIAYKYMVYSRNGNTSKNQYQSNIIKQNQMFTQVPTKV
ncbi:hypothetical protein DdX_18873 [Ditylenchus destructor]|uniref:Uncharacterized protein n=1 Tax=Ditylenchus destructor TaxID=166010 RepID=A0AAD4QXP6_9BILA|nr:hypothetical protein DdX_18873 [Ditylenchus destructor]